MNREGLKTEFLNNSELGKFERLPIKNDASYRQYERILKANGESLIFMDAPPEKEKVQPFIQVSDFLINNDISAPKIFKSDIPKGFLLLEDFGNDSYSNILAGKSIVSEELDEELMYEKAMDALIHLHKIPTNKIALNLYDESSLIKESMRFIDFYVSILNGEKLNKKMQEEYVLILKHLISSVKIMGNVVVLRDYHVDNLMWLEDRAGHRKVGMLDFQDAIIGSPVYDIVSLLEDARRDVSPELREKMIKRYLKAFPQHFHKDFSAACAIYGVQRNLKIIGTFARLASVYKKPDYLTLLPRVWRHINNDLKHPLLLPLKNWLNQIVPAQLKTHPVKI
jgi:N-acetylmuramate 1-kinase